MARLRFVVLAVMVLTSVNPVLLQATSARSARDVQEQKKAVASSVSYLRANALIRPVLSVEGGLSLTVEIENAWHSIPPNSKQAFAERINDLALVGNGGVAIPIEILVNGSRVAVSVFNNGTQFMKVTQ